MAALKDPSGDALFDFSFPTESVKNDFLSTIETHSRDDILVLLRHFLFESSTFGVDDDHYEWLLSLPMDEREHLLQKEYYQRLDSGKDAHPGVRWVIDLLPHSPGLAVNGVEAYLAAHCFVLPDARIHGLFDAMAVIRAHYIGHPTTVNQKRLFLLQLTSRDFERLVESLFYRVGYTTVLTPPRDDGGRDVLASRTEPARREQLRIECKLHTGRVRVHTVRALLGVVFSEKANKGVVVTNNAFTQGVKDFAEANPPIELLPGNELIPLLNEFLGTEWPSTIESILAASRHRHPD